MLSRKTKITATEPKAAALAGKSNSSPSLTTSGSSSPSSTPRRQSSGNVLKKISWFEKLMGDRNSSNKVAERVRKVSTIKFPQLPFLTGQKKKDKRVTKSANNNNSEDLLTKQRQRNSSVSLDKGKNKQHWLVTLLSPRSTPKKSKKNEFPMSAESMILERSRSNSSSDYPILDHHFTPTTSSSTTPTDSPREEFEKKSTLAPTSARTDSEKRKSLIQAHNKRRSKVFDVLVLEATSSTQKSSSTVSTPTGTSPTHSRKVSFSPQPEVGLLGSSPAADSDENHKSLKANGSITKQTELSTTPLSSSKGKSMNEAMIRKSLKEEVPLITQLDETSTIEQAEAAMEKLHKRLSSGTIPVSPIVDGASLVPPPAEEVLGCSTNSNSNSELSTSAGEKQLQTASTDGDFVDEEDKFASTINLGESIISKTELIPEDDLDIYKKSKEIVEVSANNGSQLTVQQAIHKAAADGDYQTLYKLIQLNPVEYVNITDPHDQSTPLHKAAARNDAAITKYLLENGAMVDHKNKENSTPLHFACANANFESVQSLCSYGATIHVRDSNGYSPLHLCLKKKCFKAADVLLLYGGDINFKRSDGSTALHYACETGDLTTVQWLLSKDKIMVNCRDNRGETPLLRAATHGRIQVVEYIMKHASVQINLMDEKRQTMLHRAARFGYHDLIMLVAFLDASACSTMLNEQDFDGRTPLHYAVLSNNFRETRLLLTMGANSTLQDKHGDTALHIAVRKKNVKIARFMSKSGCSFEIKNKKNFTAKQLAQQENIKL